MSANWTYLKGGRPLGPFTSDQMRQLASAGVLLPTDMVKSDADGVWVSAGTVPELTVPPTPSARPAPTPLPPGAVPPAPAADPARKPEPAAGRSPLAALVVWSAAAPLALVVLHRLLSESGTRLPAGVLWAGGVLALLTWLYLGARAVFTGVLPTFAGRLRHRPFVHRVGGLALLCAGWALFVELTHEARRPGAEAAAPTGPPAGYERVGAAGGEEVLYRPGHRPDAERLAGALRDLGEFNGQSPKTFAVEKRDGGWVVKAVMTDAARTNPAVHAFYRHSLGVRVAARAFPGAPVEFQFCDLDLVSHATVALPAAGVVEIQGKDAVYYLGPVRADAERVAAFLKPRLGAPGERAFVLSGGGTAGWVVTPLHVVADATDPRQEELRTTAGDISSAVFGNAPVKFVLLSNAFDPVLTVGSPTVTSAVDGRVNTPPAPPPRVAVEEIAALVAARRGKIDRRDGEIHIDLFQQSSLKDEDLSAIAQYPGLTHLNLSLTGVTREGLAHLRVARTLRGLYLHRLWIGDDALEALAGLPELEVLNLSETGVTERGIAKLSGLKKLNCLVLTGTGIRNFSALKGFPALTDLGMSENDVTDGDLAGVGDLPKLTSLSLYGTRITDAGLAHLGRSKSLRRVSLGRSSLVTDEGVDGLRRANGDIEVNRQ